MIGTLTFNRGISGGSSPQVKPVETTAEMLRATRAAGKLIPGQLYRITDYKPTSRYTNIVPTANTFDIIVMALSEVELSEDAYAVKKVGDEYFLNVNMSAWKLRYTIDNVGHSYKGGKRVTDEGGREYLTVGEFTYGGNNYIKLSIIDENNDPTYCEYACVLSLDVGSELRAIYNGEPSGLLSYVAEVRDEAVGTGTVLSLTDEHGNEAGFNFKCLKFRRYRASDESNQIDGEYVMSSVYTEIPNITSFSDDFRLFYAFADGDGDGTLSGKFYNCKLKGTNIVAKYENLICKDSVLGGSDYTITDVHDSSVIAEESVLMRVEYTNVNVNVKRSVILDAFKSTFGEIEVSRLSDVGNCELTGLLIGVYCPNGIGNCRIHYNVEIYDEINGTSGMAENFEILSNISGDGFTVQNDGYVYTFIGMKDGQIVQTHPLNA